MKVLIIGANGNTGTRVVKLLIKSGHSPLAMIRDVNQRPEFDEMGVPTVLADLEHPIDHAVSGCDAVIFAAGSGGKTGKDKTVLIDHIGAIRAAVTAQVQDAKRFIMLSSLNADPESQSSIAHYHRAKGHADHFLMETDLEYTIVCPGRLTDEEGTGKIEISMKIKGSGSTSRDNLALTLVQCLDTPETIGKRFSVLDGETPVEEALKAL